jgi:hypothetical protein
MVVVGGDDYDYSLDDDDELNEDYYRMDDEEDSDEDEEELDDEDEEEEESRPTGTDADYEGHMTKREMQFSQYYDDIIAIAKDQTNKDNAIIDAATLVVTANPKHTSTVTVSNIIKELFKKQGHNRMINTVYDPDQALRSQDWDEDLNQEDSGTFNSQFAADAKDQIARFIGYLASRDLSKDSVMSRKRKLRNIPAFIIFLFSAGMYDFLIDCPTMPEEYKVQIDAALKKIVKGKYDIVEALARRYEEKGRPKVAEKVRQMQLAWFNKEPAEIRTSSEFANLDLTYDDVVTYREYRSKFTNTSKAITQDVISGLIEVVVDKKAGIYERLKDKTRSEAIADVKQIYKDWSKDNKTDSDLASKIIWKNKE